MLHIFLWWNLSQSAFGLESFMSVSVFTDRLWALHRPGAALLHLSPPQGQVQHFVMSRNSANVCQIAESKPISSLLNIFQRFHVNYSTASNFSKNLCPLYEIKISCLLLRLEGGLINKPFSPLMLNQFKHYTRNKQIRWVARKGFLILNTSHGFPCTWACLLGMQS